MINKRIYICGPSGVGKTTLAKYIAEQYKIPFITTSTKPLWEKLGVNNHKELINKCALDPAFGLDFQNKVLEYRLNKLSGLDNWVTDRSPIDNMAYFLMQNSDKCTTEETKNYIRDCNLALALGNKLINIQYTSDIDLEDDGMRITNPYYQEYSSIIFRYILDNKVLDLNSTIGKKNILDVHTWDWEERMKIIYKFLKVRWYEKINSFNSI